MNYHANLDFEYPLLNSINTHHYFKEQIILLYYNFTRKNNDIQNLSIIFDNLLCSLKKYIMNDKHGDYKQIEGNPPKNHYLNYLILIYRMIGQTRDCFYGKGEHDISYMLLTILYNYYPILAIYVLHKFVEPLSNGDLGYGSWRDIKYFCEYLRLNTRQSIHHPLIKYSIHLMNNALKRDYDTWNSVMDNYFQQIIRSSSFSSFETIKKPMSREHLTAVSKWIPREHTKFDWLNEMLVIDWFETYKSYILTSHTCVAGYYNALTKCKLLYRKMISKMNKVLDTTEIKLCSGKLDEIVPKHIPQILFMKNKNKLWFNNILDNTKMDFVTNNNNSIKNKCANDFQRHFEKKFFLLSPFDPNRISNNNIPNDVPLHLFIKEAYNLYKLKKSSANKFSDTKGSQILLLKIDILNHQWNQISSILGHRCLNDFIPIIDTSFEINNLSDAFFSSIGLAFLICSRSSLGKRIIAIDHQPSWINLDACSDLFSMTTTIFDCIINNCNTNYNIYEAFHLIITSMDETKMSYRKIANLSLVLFHHFPLTSDFHSLVTDLFSKKGIVSSRGKPFPVPRVIYWNISNKICSQLPFKITDENVYSLSGMSCSLFRHLYNLDLSYCNMNSYEMICKILNNSRYDDLGNYILDLYS
jgi:hypothetical protein